MSEPALDFANRYRAAWARARRSARAPEYWDARARRMSETVFDAAYVSAFLERFDRRGCTTLLDVGCGPGTIAVSVADGLERVYALDYSEEMLRALSKNAAGRGLTNLTAIRRGWDDDWTDVPECDLVVASRSTAVPDLEAACLKLESKARVRIYLTYPADGHFVGEEVCRAIGRTHGSLPDYLCVVGVLHDLGRYPTLDYLPGENRLAHCPTFEKFLAKTVDLLGPLSATEDERLRLYYEASRDRFHRETMRWAMCSWEPPSHLSPGCDGGWPRN